MSELKTLIRKSKAANKGLVATTVRMPKELHLYIEELAEKLGISKQEAILKLVEAGVEVAELELEKEEDVFANFHVLNTNRRHNENDQEQMISLGIAAAFYDPWKYNINRIKEGDVVFLYENGVGIVAYGKGTGTTKKKVRDGNKDECHYQELTDFTVLEKALTAAKIKMILGRNVVFLRTMAGMPDGQKIIDEISK
ncbi:MAG: hypothetical protein COW18_09375 [Zetaproteobacteria bacterium CG12_big_fil_rev_8_21_14_0_65_54_13]|nr:MAG: hypothetical protein COW18_09375 [Zetaproteobacteria bacterium CG12_big_fil_rev_8_21_14_0_65_54_13]PIX55665.1 MAG: hypothetical protein COZ50_01505 [Zetaproteobacteria bacterium CG_4_10_14_3_um_filter_54_28]PJA30277.1 MAG: hypothetical protein CO188_04135 [Zetaproteobacteria bacterium CG_4_9_14_3_um_filter_54_145]